MKADDVAVWYLNALMRGRELTLGLETPLLNRDELKGCEEILKDLWATANPSLKEDIEEAVAGGDRLLGATSG